MKLLHDDQTTPLVVACLDYHFPNEEPETNTSKIPLLNYAALKVFEQGGKVFLENKEDLPDSSSKINALFRY